MARQLRLDFAGAIHHVTARGNERRSLFRCDADRRLFLQLLGDAAKRFRWSVAAYVLMTNHFHILIQTPEANLSRGMHWLAGAYAMRFNRRYGRSGHLFQGRFHSFLVDRDSYFSEVLRYVVLNPVRAKMVVHAEDYRWSSYRATAGLTPAPKWLDVSAALAPFETSLGCAQSEYAAFVCAATDSGDRLWDRAVHGIYLGAPQWITSMRKIVESRIRSTEHPKAQRAVGRPRMHAVIDAVARAAGTTARAIRAARGGTLRQLSAWIGWNEGLQTLASIAAALRLRSAGHVSNLIRRCEAAFSADARLLANCDAALSLLR
jgi:putative transposase